ncbi:iron ABC transporter permease [Gordonia sp. (in: high G+C Gram-positive bacteria)]|uniref:FecCD family ABC transporter permease n=1 Tax=Gordonia sp. (in: high G+C Gram-positive bacteria) TaxID=84139 RepID=UPI0025C5266D|nr:iron ABC transporter permease [Gordonia sp. (in: high G+C Gram-positive bacteria)]
MPDRTAMLRHRAASTRSIFRGKALWSILGTLILLGVVVVISAGTGQVHIPPLEVLGSIAHHWHLEIGPLPSHPQGENALWVSRFPRILLGLLVGVALGTAGCLLQGVLANPLAEPGIIGVSSGAAVGACLVIVIGGTGTNGWAIAGAAALFGLITTAGVYVLSIRDGASSTIMLVLTGIAVNAFCLGIIAYLTYIASTAAREQIVFWQLGSLAGNVSWTQVKIVAPLAIAGVAGGMLLVRKLDLLALGEVQAASLGVNVEVVRRQVIVLVAMLTAAGVAFTGIVMFVGLIVPHVMRLLVGPKHAVLLPASALGGALVIAAADLGARSLTGGELPLGMLTSLIGGPIFFLLLRQRNAAARW